MVETRMFKKSILNTKTEERTKKKKVHQKEVIRFNFGH